MLVLANPKIEAHG